MKSGFWGLPLTYSLLLVHLLMCRWENCLALGASRKALGAPVPLADAWWYFFRLPLLDNVPVARVQKRLLHLCSQRVELGFANGHIPLRDVPPRPQGEGDALTPWSTGGAVRSANLAREQLLKRFVSRGGGFVTGLQNAGNKEICPVELGHRGTKSRNMGTVAADQYITAYMLSASQAFLKKLSAQRYKHMAWYEDASKVGTFEDGSV